ncbi:MAG: 50S ribosomal protein L32 [Dehalococcoidia bacterium]
MPPLPKRRRSKSRQGTINAHRHTALPNLVECSNCHQPMQLHRVCPRCGYYRGRDILAVETEL